MKVFLDRRRVETLSLQEIKRVDKPKALLSTIVLRMDRVLDSHLSMEPSKDWYQEVQTIETVVVFAMKVLKTTETGNGHLITSPDDGLTVAHLPLSVEGAALQLSPPLRENACIPLIRGFFDVCRLEYILTWNVVLSDRQLMTRCARQKDPVFFGWITLKVEIGRIDQESEHQRDCMRVESRSSIRSEHKDFIATDQINR
jgi:hypothetical protein